MSQLELPLDWPADSSADVFLIGEANSRAVHMLEHRGAWPVMAAILTGPRKSGRSRLARIFASRTGGHVFDDAQSADETRLFHAWNLAQAQRTPLLIICDSPPPQWQVKLPDLRSRLAATPVLRIDPPDDTLIAELLGFWFARREIVAGPEVLEWLSKRTERSYVALLSTVEAIEDGLRGARSRRLTVPRARDILSEAKPPSSWDHKQQG
ncbi:chromosomal replication initiator DnaA [Stakelama sp. CBK3Z-3]|uniref:Chromosomal replication initiator DnaA n=1 Tax=Stakelama flava TaxID=2860338 RepID=A0ABS6XL48_9SPHN|nr:chromosomal replication initiator DnaA [Stakelama flava]MBW4330927.1 chromosomal replication initiator DnaA [Stakelama flava]